MIILSLSGVLKELLILPHSVLFLFNILPRIDLYLDTVPT